MPPSFTLGRVFGIRVNLHFSWLFVYALVTWSIASGIASVSFALSLAIGALCSLLLFGSVVVHEFAHALTARRYGVRTRGITLFLFGGVATLENEPPSPRAELAIALAGPLASVALAALATLLTLGVDRASGLVGSVGSQALGLVLAYAALANAVLAAFNLVPAFPMDGGRVLRAILWKVRRSHASATAIASLVGLAFAAIVVISGVVMLATAHLWQYGWYVVLGSFLARASWTSYAQARLAEHLERAPFVAVAPRGSAA